MMTKVYGSVVLCILQALRQKADQRETSVVGAESGSTVLLLQIVTALVSRVLGSQQ